MRSSTYVMPLLKEKTVVEEHIQALGLDVAVASACALYGSYSRALFMTLCERAWDLAYHAATNNQKKLIDELYKKLVDENVEVK